MADFIAVIRRAVDGLSNNTPEMRAKVYDKARSAVLRQLENMNPRPPEAMIQRQLTKLDVAIEEVEAEHAEAMPEEEAVATFEEAMTPQPTAEDEWAEQSSSAEEREAEAQPVVVEEPVQEEPVARPAEDWAAPAEPEYHSEPEAIAEHQEYAEPEEHAEAAYAEEAEQAREPEAEQEAPVQWADEPVQTVEEPVEETVVPAVPAYEDVDHSALPPVEQEQVYASPTLEEEPEEHRASVRADEAEAEIAEIESVAPEPSVFEPAPVVPAYNRVMEVPITGGSDWSPRGPANADVDQAGPVEPQPDVAQPVEYEPWELPVEPAAAAPEASQSAALDLPDWDSSTYAQPSATAVDSASRDLPAAEDFSDWFAEYDKPSPSQTTGAVEGEVPAVEPAPIQPGVAPEAEVPPRDGEDVDAFLAETQQRVYRIEPKQRRNYAPVVLGILGAALIAGGGFAAWSYRDQVSQFIAGLTGSSPATETAQTPETQPGASTGAETATGQPAMADGGKAPAKEAADDGATSGQKFTQRLKADGTEVDEGAGTTAPGGPATEGKSVSQQNVASAVEPTDQPAVGTNAGVPQAVAPSGTAPASGVAAAVDGERAFLYEERLGQTTPTAIPGTIAWTAVRETGEDGKPNPEIQGKITFPDRGLTALMTIKRNSDSSLPASHLIEVVFSLPADFEGGAIDKLERISMKRTEQDRGDNLVAVSAKITDDTYLVALNDFADVAKSNLDLLANRGWIDIPISYRNGRRALLTLDKGAAGAAVFDQVMKEWAALGTPGN
ncbi:MULTISPECIES: hypothetical protein [Alphaproteobacteria]|uniref:Uncharacterized protein n=2 Tax=Alphaproteobacteria TaxID=28211 RepID=A0A512HJK9_9HYPH|nr:MULTISPECIES: hypothetical protein [Alphaproteobacteria]GEO85633.1 hypothetical protein RNA01_25650 [Ciceribacter naphthalenivorans]GLR22012.1 hypothetical protein GCM10007920_17990 [Ciceribacter naphthalenivorans]GLT04868.1 hypothetical protein GCM10007926_17990 [Sphingomonas psychrolutea]